jgi:hypothetical protein
MDHTLFWIAIIFLILVGQIYLLGRKMSEPQKMLRITGGLSPYQQQMLSPYEDWLASVNLEFRYCHQFGNIQSALFQQRNEPRFFSFRFHQRLTFNAESYLEDLTVLDTSTSGSMGLFPRPGAFAQDFPNASPQEVWQRHLVAEAFLTKKFGFVWAPLKQPYEQILLEAVRLRMKYNRSQTLWPLRVLYRYFTTRYLLRNRSIEQQLS